MTIKKINIGPYQAVFIGNYLAIDPLFEITDINTGPSELYEGYEDKYFPGLGKQLQVGTYISTIPIEFYDSDKLIVKNLARGVSVDNTDINTPPENTLYTLLLLGYSETDRTSVLIQPCRTTRKLSITRAKNAASAISLFFTAEDPSRYSEIITYGTPAELGVVLGARSPF